MTPDESAQALCAQVGGELFFLDEDARGNRTKRGFLTWEMRMAKSICEQCPVKQPCLEEALANPGLQGVWGGTTGNERRRMRRQARVS